jgi:hypothetical protein
MEDFLNAIRNGMQHGWRVKFGSTVYEGFPASVIVLSISGLATLGACDVVLSLYRLFF